MRRREVSTSITSVSITPAYEGSATPFRNTIATRDAAEEGGSGTGGATGAPPFGGKGWIVFARSTTIAARTHAINAGIAHVRDEVMPALDTVDGCVGLSLMVDRESGECVLTTAWRSQDAMHASAAAVAPMRHRVVEMFAGTAAVDEWEIAVVHREQYSGPGACVRATWLRTRPELFDRAVDFYRSTVLPAMEDLEGFCSASLMLDRASGRAVSSATFDSADAMDHNRDEARALRTDRLRDLSADQLHVGEYELVLAHLRVPEMA